jgi:hypothetical protein
MKIMSPHVKLLECPEFPADSNSPPVEKRIVHPTWQEIEATIRKLDKHVHPFIVLAPVLDESERFNGDSDFFEVIGGNGDYWVAGSINGYWQRRAVNPLGDDNEIDLWTSHQGFSSPSEFVLHDLNVVLRAAKYYYEYNEFDPNLEWEDQTPIQ